MKGKILLLEAGGILISVAGAILLVAGFLPVINPAFLTSRGYDANLTSPKNIGLLVGAAVVLVIGISLNLKAKSLKRSDN